MKQFKLRKIYGTGLFKILCLTIILFSFLVYFCITWTKPKEVVLYEVPEKTVQKTANTIESLKFNGEKINTINFNKRYAEVIYKENDTEVSHFIDIKKNKEVTINEFIKDKDAFYNKIHELLLLKYPSKIVSYLESSNPKYIFRQNNLDIYYDIKDKVETTRSFNLTVDYNEIHTMLNFPVELNENYENESGYNYDPNKTTIAFTFDDGPNGERTKTLINTLEDYKMSATFFMLGSRFENNSDIVKLVYDSHSEVGYHNYNHTYYTKEKASQIISEFEKADAAYFAITNDHLKLTRPPYGNYNQTTLDSLPTPLIRWNLDTNDWRYKEFDYLTNYVLDNLSDGSIILFHDTYDTSITTATALMEMLYLKDIQVVNVTELAKIQNVPLEGHNVYYSFK